MAAPAASADPIGRITEFGLNKGIYPSGIARCSDGNLWFADYGMPAIGRMTRSGQVADFSAA